MPETQASAWAAVESVARAMSRALKPGGINVAGQSYDGRRAGVMEAGAGYSGTPLPRKLGIKEGSSVRLVGAPSGFEGLLGTLPDGVDLGGHPPLDVALLFTPDMDALARGFDPLVTDLDKAGGLWVAWPKKSSGVPTDLDENRIRDFGLERGLVDNKVCAIDATWSGLRFVIRRENR